MRVFAVPDSKMRMRRRAVRALMSHTQNAIRDLRNDEDEMLRGADPLSDSDFFPPICPNAVSPYISLSPIFHARSCQV